MAESKKGKHRKVKNPETFRQKAVKASENNGKEGTLKKAILRILAVIYRISPFRALLKWLINTKLVKLIWKIIRKPARIIGLIIVPRYVRNSWKELKLVTWPSFKTSRKLTYAVIIFAIVFGVVVAAVDFVFNKLFKNILLR